jgi:hypothetical protein
MRCGRRPWRALDHSGGPGGDRLAARGRAQRRHESEGRLRSEPAGGGRGIAHPVEGLAAPVGTAIEDTVYTRRAVTDATVRP